MREKTVMINSNSIYKAIFDISQVIILLLSPDGKIVDFNPYMESLCGYKINEVKSKDWFEVFLPKDIHEQVRSIFTSAIDGTETKGNINPIICKNGSQKLIEWYDRSFKDEKGNTICLISIGQDVTLRERSQNDLRLFRTLIDASIDAIAVVDPETGKFLDINNSMCLSSGYSREELLDMCVSDMDVSIPGLEPWEERVREIRKTGTALLEGTRKTKDGKTDYFEVNVKLVTMQDKEYMIAVIRDISNRKKNEEELKEKLHSLEVFQKASVGRELKMTELKEKIKELESEIAGLKNNSDTR